MLSSFIDSNNSHDNIRFKTLVGDEQIVDDHFHNLDMDNYDIYDFCVNHGQSIPCIFQYIEYHSKQFNNFIGFDSYIHNLTRFFDINDYKQTEKYIDYLITENRLDIKYKKKFIFIKGEYKTSLNSTILHQLKLPILIIFENDVHISTFEALNFIFENKLYIKGKTIIRYDTWNDREAYGSKPGGKRYYLKGQIHAHEEMTDKYNINCELLLKQSYNENRETKEMTWWLIT